MQSEAVAYETPERRSDSTTSMVAKVSLMVSGILIHLPRDGPVMMIEVDLSNECVYE